MLLLLELRLKQMMGGEGIRGILKFFAPYLMVGLFLALSYGGLSPTDPAVKFTTISVGVALFTSIAETRKLFFSGGDAEDFYFVQPGFMSRFAFLFAILVLNVAVVFSIFIPIVLLPITSGFRFRELVPEVYRAAFVSASIYMVLLATVSVASEKSANVILTCLQIIAALALLATFPLLGSAGWDRWITVGQRETVWVILVLSLLFVVSPLAETLVRKLSHIGSLHSFDLYRVTEMLKVPAFVRSPEEEAGFLFFLSGISRDASFRLSSIGIAATPVMVAFYWSVRRIPVVHLSLPGSVLGSDFAAPIASLVISGVLVHYFLSQNVVCSKNHEARWMLQVRKPLDTGKFILGVRKGLLMTVHIPMTVGVFLAILLKDSVVDSLIVAMTFYLLCHVAASFFSVMQRNVPFSLPFTRIGATETVNLLFMVGYSLFVTVILFYAVGNPIMLLLVNLFAFILVGLLEFSSIAIVNKRVRLDAR
ncbi:MAG: hypothetical protein M1339_08345 [Bacteroidetes bacterium]|nr:hypothetical protein [Bacteroidota bacterium]